jgi:hypothetical protein
MPLLILVTRSSVLVARDRDPDPDPDPDHDHDHEDRGSMTEDRGLRFED